jgi:hypothetical protein
MTGSRAQTAGPTTGAPGRITRRDALRRGAVLGGAVVWATPAVQSIARPAFADHRTPEADFSVIAIVVERPGGGFCSYKFDDNGWRQGGNTSRPGCTPAGWDQRSNCPEGPTQILSGPDGPDHDCFYTVRILTNPGDAGWRIHAATIKQGPVCTGQTVQISGDRRSVRLRPPRHDC